MSEVRRFFIETTCPDCNEYTSVPHRKEYCIVRLKEIAAIRLVRLDELHAALTEHLEAPGPLVMVRNLKDAVALALQYLDDSVKRHMAELLERQS